MLEYLYGWLGFTIRFESRGYNVHPSTVAVPKRPRRCCLNKVHDSSHLWAVNNEIHFIFIPQQRQTKEPEHSIKPIGSKAAWTMNSRQPFPDIAVTQLMPLPGIYKTSLYQGVRFVWPRTSRHSFLTELYHLGCATDCLTWPVSNRVLHGEGVVEFKQCWGSHRCSLPSILHEDLRRN